MDLTNLRDGDGFLKDPSIWTEEVMLSMMADDNVEPTEDKEEHIAKARAMYEADGVVPPIRVFAKELGMDRKARGLYDEWKSGPMKQIAKYGGLPKPTGCV